MLLCSIIPETGKTGLPEKHLNSEVSMRPDISELEKRAASIRRRIIKLTGIKGVGHTGGSLSMVEIMTALYFHHMRVDPANTNWLARDRFILSKGHATPGYYSVLAERGFFSEEDLFSEYDEIDSRFQGHPDMHKTPGVDISSGSLGQGLSVGIGMALGIVRRGLDSKVYVVMGDGEIQEGQVWEALLYAGLHKVPNLIAIIDNNHLQLTARTGDIMDMNPIAEKIVGMGWRIFNCDGHDLEKLVNVIEEAKEHSSAGPCLIVAETIKGKGVSFIENRVEWHSRACNTAEMQAALKELEAKQ